MPQFYLRATDITGKVELPENVKMVMPGDNVTAVFDLISPVPLEPGVSNLISSRKSECKGVTCMLIFLRNYERCDITLLLRKALCLQCLSHITMQCLNNINFSLQYIYWCAYWSIF